MGTYCLALPLPRPMSQLLPPPLQPASLGRGPNAPALGPAATAEISAAPVAALTVPADVLVAPRSGPKHTSSKTRLIARLESL
jgi:hypothetical protein